jgi:ubiquinone/menaquinone biosynthesis C-methylase UbiE
MNDESHSRRARSFGSVAEVYREARPGYPPAAVEWALEHAPGRDVLDLAAGTGKLTEMIAATGARVIAVEPLEGMRRELAATVPDATLLPGTAEQIPLADGAVDAVLVGQAFHWFDQPRALDEMARVLRPGGVVGLIWNLRDESEEWAQRMTELLDSADVVSSGVDREAEALAAHERFGAVEHSSWPNPVVFDRERLRAWARSTSIIATMEPAQAGAVVDALVDLADQHPQLRHRETFEMPYVTFALRARRTG